MSRINTGRNSPCPCGSGRKYKRCHGPGAQVAGHSAGATLTPFDRTVTFSSHHDSRIEVLGSGVMVYPGLFATAAHVVEEWLLRYANIEPRLLSEEERLADHFISDPDLTVDFRVVAVQARAPNSSRPRNWYVTKMYKSGHSDIALVAGSMVIDEPRLVPAEVKWTHIQLHSPGVGSTVFVTGYPRTEVHQSEFTDTTMQLKPTLLKGTVVEVAERGRGSLKPFPHFDIDVETQGGMSGGPVLDANGHLIGLLSTGWQGIPLSSAALLWPMFSIPFEGSTDGGQPVRALTLYELARQGYDLGSGLEHLVAAVGGSISYSTTACEHCRNAGGPVQGT